MEEHTQDAVQEDVQAPAQEEEVTTPTGQEGGDSDSTEQKSDGDKDFRALRQKAKRADNLSQQLQSLGYKVDGEGNIIKDEAQEKTQEQRMEEIALAQAQKLSVNNAISSKLQDYTPEEQALIQNRFEKLSNGESVTLQNVDEYFTAALGAAGLQTTTSHPARRAANLNGSGPSTVPPANDDFTTSEKGKEMAKALFGDDSWVAKQGS